MNAADDRRPCGVQIRPQWLAMVQEILREYVPEREVRAYGSRVSGQPRPFSDLDLFICGPEPPDVAALDGLIEALEESDLPINVDAVPEHLAGPHIIAAVRRHSAVIQTGRRHHGKHQGGKEA